MICKSQRSIFATSKNTDVFKKIILIYQHKFVQRIEPIFISRLCKGVENQINFIFTATKIQWSLVHNDLQTNVKKQSYIPIAIAIARPKWIYLESLSFWNVYISWFIISRWSDDVLSCCLRFIWQLLSKKPTTHSLTQLFTF